MRLAILIGFIACAQARTGGGSLNIIACEQARTGGGQAKQKSSYSLGFVL